MRGACRLKAHEVGSAANAGLGGTPLWRAARLLAGPRDFTFRIWRWYSAGVNPYAHGTAYIDGLLIPDIMAKRKVEEVLAVERDAAQRKKVKKTADADIAKQKAASPKSDLVERANKLSTKRFQAAYLDTDMLHYDFPKKDLAVDITLRAADWLSPGEHNASFNLVKTTSRNDYEASSWGWHPTRKRKEMLEPEMKYLFIRNRGSGPTIEQGKNGDVDISMEGFVSFMLTHDSSPVVPVIYLYEIHLTESFRGIRLGQHMMALVESIARKAGVSKVMLTCFLHNEKAHGFYKSLGYMKDVSSPEDRKTRNKVVKVDYEIMGKDVWR